MNISIFENTFTTSCFLINLWIDIAAASQKKSSSFGFLIVVLTALPGPRCRRPDALLPCPFGRLLSGRACSVGGVAPTLLPGSFSVPSGTREALRRHGGRVGGEFGGKFPFHGKQPYPPDRRARVNVGTPRQNAPRHCTREVQPFLRPFGRGCNARLHLTLHPKLQA